jgi:hypothetical protein
MLKEAFVLISQIYYTSFSLPNFFKEKYKQLKALFIKTVSV